MQHVRRGRVKGVHTLRDSVAEVLEAEVSDTATIANKTISEIDLQDELDIGCIVRDGEFMLPAQDLKILPGDHVIVLAKAGHAREMEQFFTVQVDLF